MSTSEQSPSNAKRNQSGVSLGRLRNPIRVAIGVHVDELDVALNDAGHDQARVGLTDRLNFGLLGCVRLDVGGEALSERVCVDPDDGVGGHV